jgi:hypothetical protein
MLYRRLLLVTLAALPLAALVLIALTCDAISRDLSQVRYCVLDNTPQHRVLIRNCIAAGRCQNGMTRLRASLDGSKVIIKWSLEDGPPEVIPAAVKDVCSAILTNREAKALMATPEWSQP